MRSIHETPLHPAPQAPPPVDPARRLEDAVAWVRARAVVPADVLERNHRLARLVLQPCTPALLHGDLQPDHVFVDDEDCVTGVIDWSGAGPGDPLLDLAVLTLGHPEHLDDVAAGYGRPVDLDVVRAWWAYRSLTAVPWLAEHGFDAPETFPETAVLLRGGH